MALSYPAVSGAAQPELRESLAALLGGSPLPAGVRADITASWRRSLASGLEPDRLDVPEADHVDLDGQLVRAAAPVLDRLGTDVGTAEVAFVLTEQRGEVLDRRVTEGSLMHELDRILLVPGFAYREDAVGTNGIGMTLAQGHPGLVRGDEHFADALTRFACAASPIRDPASGQVIGAIDLTTFVGDANALMLPFVRQAAREIEHRLVDMTGVAERIMLHRYLQERKRAKGPVVLMTAHRMVANAAATRLVTDDDEPILRDAADRVRDRDGAVGSTTVELASGRVVALQAEDLLDGSTAVGVLIRLREVDDGVGRQGFVGSRATFGWNALTATERTVVELVAEGLTNQEAAERLLLSRHTVGFHLRSIFRKLAVSSRVELARLVAERTTD